MVTNICLLHELECIIRPNKYVKIKGDFLYFTLLYTVNENKESMIYKQTLECCVCGFEEETQEHTIVCKENR